MSHGSHGHGPVWSGGHQPDRISIRTIVIFGIGTVVLVVVAGVITAAWIGALNHHRPDRLPANLATADNVPDRVQEWQTPGIDLTRLRAEQSARLNSSGWVDDSHTVARIPIERAMQLIAQEQGEKKP